MADQKETLGFEDVTSHIESMADERAPPKLSFDDLKEDTRIDPNNPQVYPCYHPV